MNEAMSDIFGEYQDMLNGTDSRTGATDGILNPADPNNWKMGEDLTIGAIRSMANPGTYGDPDRTRSANYYDPADVNFSQGTGDSGGVHTNSGVGNKAAYLMAVGGSFNGQTITKLGTGLGPSIKLATQIWYDVQYILTSGSDYNVLDKALVTACNGLVNVTVPGTTEKLTASDCTEVDQITTATQMNLEPGSAGYSPEALVNCNVATRTIQDLFSQTFESGTGGFSFGTLSGTRNWVRINDYAAYGNYALWGEDTIGSDNYARLSSAVTLTGGSEYYLFFKHSYGFEGPNYDGGTLEYSTNGGSTWTRAGALFKDGRTFSGTINGTSISAFLQDSHGFNSSRYTLTSFAGQSILFRWRIKTDGSVQDLGWILDNVRIYRCV
jgi:hypothetical protein